MNEPLRTKRDPGHLVLRAGWPDFVSAWNAIHQQTGDLTDRHLQKGGYAENQVVTTIIRYQDRYAAGADGWRIAWRKEIIDWTEVGRSGREAGVGLECRE